MSKWFNLGGEPNPPASSSNFPQMPNINIPGFTRQEEPTLANEMCEMCPSLTFQQRLIGFGVCLLCGYLLSFLSTVLVISGDLTGFSMLYCLGSLIAIGATGFLIGPGRQVKKMFARTRRVACIIYLVLLVTVLALALANMPFGVVLITLILQMVAAVWYTASYIPYGRAMIKNVVCPCFKDLEDGQQG